MISCLVIQEDRVDRVTQYRQALETSPFGSTSKNKIDQLLPSLASRNPLRVLLWGCDEEPAA